MKRGELFQIPTYDIDTIFVYLGTDSAALNERVYALFDSNKYLKDDNFKLEECKDIVIMHSLDKTKIQSVGKTKIPLLSELKIRFATENNDYINENTMEATTAKNWITWISDDNATWQRVFSLESTETYYDGGSYPAHLLFSNGPSDFKTMHLRILHSFRIKNQ